MKKLFLVAVAGFFFTANSKAQVQREMPQRHPVQSDSSSHPKRGKMMQELDLTASQQTQMKALHQDMMQQRKAIQNDANLSIDQKKEKMKELRQNQMQKMNGILTPDQLTKMKTFREKGKQDHRMHKGFQQMQQINLTSRQQTQMKALHETIQQQRNAIQNDPSLSTAQKKEKMKRLHKTQMEKVNTILTPEQQEKMKAFREQRRQNHKAHKMDTKMTQNEQS